MQPVGLANTGISTDYAQISARTLILKEKKLGHHVCPQEAGIHSVEGIHQNCA